MKHRASFRTGLPLLLALVALPSFVLPTPSLAQAFVTGSGNTDGFSIVGAVRDAGGGTARGGFTIIVHLDVVSGGTTAAVCSYRVFDNLAILGNSATFHSVGSCLALNDLGTVHSFTSDNVFSIVDNGEPGPGFDAIDVNLVSGGGITIPGSFLVDGNFLVSP